MIVDHFRMLASYSGWANARLHAVTLGLSDEDFRRPIGLFFGSLHGTLNHLLVADRIWLWRLTGQGDHPPTLDAIIHDDPALLARARYEEDQRLTALVDGYVAADLAGSVSYRTLGGAGHEQRLAEILAHMFNHQTHHRGQAHTACSILGIEPPGLDLLLYQRGVTAPDLANIASAAPKRD